MIGDTAFCPRTGAQLADERHYDEHGRALRVPTEDEFVAGEDLDGALTTGAVRSSRQALLTQFRRTHQRHRCADPDRYRQVALWLRRLKGHASGSEESDTIVWLALGARLCEAGDAGWMLEHVELRCPRCHGRLDYEQPRPDALVGVCATDCTGDRRNRLAEIERLATDLCERTFDVADPRLPERWYATVSERG